MSLLTLFRHGARRTNARYINPATGSDANTGLTPATAWATVAPANTALAAANNRITHLRIDTSGAPLYLTAALVVGSNTRSITVEGATPGVKADIRAYKVLSNAAFTQPDVGTYPNVWQIADSALHSVLWERDGSAAYDLIWYTHPIGANFAAVAATLNSTAGSFWTDGTTMYFRPLTGNDPVGDGKEYVRSYGIQTAAIDCTSAPGVIVRNLMLGGTCLARSTDSDPIGAYCINVTPAAGTSIVNDCLLYYGSKHNLAFIEGANNSTAIAERVQCEQGSPYVAVGGQSVFVSYATTGTGLRHIYRRCSSVKNAGLVGSKAGTAAILLPAMLSHSGGSGVQFASILIDACSYPRMAINQNHLQWASGNYVVQNSRIGKASCVDMTLIGCYIDDAAALPASGTGAARLYNCILSDLTVATEGFQTSGTLYMENCTIDTRVGQINFRNAWLLRTGVLILTMKNCIFLSGVNGANNVAIAHNCTNADTIVLSRNVFHTPTSDVIFRNYNDGTTVANRTLAQVQALGLDTASLDTDPLLNVDLTPTAPSPARNLAVTSLTSDYVGDITPRVTSGAYEYRA